MKRRIRIIGAAIVGSMLLISGCGGGGGGGSSSSVPQANSSIKGVATPSNVSVVTAQNASAGG